MNNNLTFQGVFPVLPTVFHGNGEIDESGLESVLEYVIACGAGGVVFPGLASEYDHLSDEERVHLVSLLGKLINNRVPFIVGASSPDSEKVVDLAKQGSDSGACASMILTPAKLANDPDGLKEFFTKVGRESGIPIMMQNAPKPMGIALSIEAIQDIANDVDAIKYVKEETPPCGQRITALRERSGDALIGIYGGAGGRYVIDEFNRGALGTLPATEVTEIHVQMFKAHSTGNFDLARDLFDRALPLLNMQAVFRWRLTKEVLKRRGIIESAFVRAPGPELDVIDQEEVSVLLDRLSDLVPLSSGVAPVKLRG